MNDACSQQTGASEPVKSVSVVVVSYNTSAMTLACLDSILGQTLGLDIEVVVVDNASTDGSADAISGRFPDTQLIASQENLGFAGANNLAAGSAVGKYLLLLNPDTVVLNGAIDRLVAFADAHPEAGIFGGRTVFPDGSLNPASCFRSPTLRGLLCRAMAFDVLFSNSELANPDCYGGWKRDSIREVDIVSGCFLLIRRELWNRLAGFDTDFFMYGEDWDLCLRARALGQRCLLCPGAEIVHYGGASEPVQAARIIRLLRTKALLFRKHWHKTSYILGLALLESWVLLRLAGFGLAFYLFRTRSEEYGCWLGVWAARGQWRA